MQRTGLVIIIKPIEIGHEDITKITVLNSPYFTRKIKSLQNIKYMDIVIIIRQPDIVHKALTKIWEINESIDLNFARK